MKKLAGAVNCRYLLSLLLSILFAFLIGAGILAVSGFHPLEAYGAMLSGAFDSARHIGDFLEYAMVLCVCGLACVRGARVGIFNVGGAGVVRVGGEDYRLGYKEALYLGMGDREVLFESIDPAAPAKFYFNSVCAHCNYPDRKITKEDAVVAHMGSLEGSNERDINKMIVSQVLPTCRLQMGMTEVAPGSVWNTMPAHIHSRRMEAYFYFELPDDQAVCHMMGEPRETRHIWMCGEQAVLSPEWSIHSAAATHNYTFIWGMGGENLDYGDQDFFAITDLR